MAADPLLNRPFGAFEPDRLLSRPTDERPQKPQWDQKRKAASSHRRTQVSGTKTVVIGACAPIHPRVGPAVRRAVVFANRFRNLSHRHTSGPTRVWRPHYFFRFG